MVHGGERLARADAAVVGRDHAVQQHAESRSPQQVSDKCGQQPVLEHAAGQRADVQAGVLPDELAGLRDHARERGVEHVREDAGLDAGVDLRKVGESGTGIYLTGEGMGYCEPFQAQKNLGVVPTFKEPRDYFYPIPINEEE